MDDIHEQTVEPDLVESGKRKRPNKSAEKSRKNFSALREMVEKTIDSTVEFEALINIGGRNISDSFIIYDEFQDTERFQAKALLTRVGNNSKVVAMGDPFQVNNPHLNVTSNGLSYSASKLAGSDLACVVTLDKSEIVRSPAALEIAACFE